MKPLSISTLLGLRSTPGAQALLSTAPEDQLQGGACLQLL